MNIGVAIGIGSVIALALTIAVCIIIIPKSREGQFTGFMKFVRDYFLMKYLVIEAVLRFFFILNTFGCIFIGFFLLFARTPSYYYYGYGYDGESTAVVGICLIIFGPIVVRLTYELSMLAIMLLKNVMEINAKMKGDAKGVTSAFEMPIPKNITMPNMGAPAGGMNPASNVPPVPPVPPVQPMSNMQAMNMSNDENIQAAEEIIKPADTNQQANDIQAEVAPQAGDTKVCPSCGAVVSASSKFCTNCGSAC